MNEQDLSLLTDDERELLKDVRRRGLRLINSNELEMIFATLIAARAENKRLLDGLVDMLPLANLGIVACERAGSNNVENMRVQHRVAKEAASLSLEARRTA